jgi:hypothetical protein
MLCIGDVVSLDSHAAFVNDVQLSAYDEAQKNIRLLRSYLFSSAKGQTVISATNEVTPVELLRRLTDIYLSDRSPNRLVVVANYGHGKSHLALALANYFGRAASSEEFKVLLPKIDAAVADAPSRQRYRDFKATKGPFLLVRLRGDEPSTLQAQFISGLERGLAEHAATRSEGLPFWYQTAERYLTALLPEQVQRANVYLRPKDKDVPLLLEQIRARQDVLHDAVGTIEAATGVKPDLNDVGLAQAIEWAASKFVGQDKPFGGILVLFDEFTLYLSRYAQQGAAAELQDLLNGIQKTQGKTAFLALAQMDPDATADHLTLSGSGRAELKKALSRIETKLALSTVMESVIDAYLVQSEEGWKVLNQTKPVHGALVGAGDTAMITFSRRYERTLRWNSTQFNQVITQGCFPLHPITTALLCNMSLGTVSDAGSARTVLGFVMTQLEAKKEQAAIVGTRPNWVLPISLIDYFGVRFSGDAYRSYETALRTVGADITDEQAAILKALLLQELAQMALRSEDQFNFLCAAAGLERPAAGTALKALLDANAIRQDSVKKTYSLWPVTADPGKLERLLRKRLELLRYDAQAEIGLNTKLRELLGASFGEQPMDVKWGHAKDWAVEEVIATPETPLADKLASLQPVYRYDPKNGALIEKSRGYVFWLLARTDAERAELRQTAESLLDQVFTGDSPPPVVMVMPEAPQPDMIEHFQRLRALVTFTPSERAEIGAEMMQAEINRMNIELTKALIELRKSDNSSFDVPRATSNIAVPVAYRALVKEQDKASLKTVFQECYAKAYRYRPPEFDTRYPVTGKGPGKLKSATSRVASSLLRNASKSLPDVTASDSFTRDLYEKYLVKSWGMLSRDLRLQKPAAPGVRAAWDYLDQVFKDDQQSRRLDNPLIQLLNPPFGFDYNTAVLVFAGWFGYNALDLRISKVGRIEKVDIFNTWLEAGARDFFKQIRENSVMLSRVSAPPVDDIMEELDARQGRVYSQEEAKQEILRLQGYAVDLRLPQNVRERVQSAIDELEQDAAHAAAYDQQVADINRDIFGSNSLPKLIDAQKRIANLPATGPVRPTMPEPSEIRAALGDAIQLAAEKAALQHSALHDIADYQSNRSYLVHTRKELADAGLAAQVKIIDDAIARLDGREKELRQEAAEAITREKIASMRVDLPLMALYDERDALNGLAVDSPKTVALRDEKLASIVKEINRLQKAAGGLDEEALAHTDLASLQQYRDILVQKSGRYAGSPYATAFNKARERADHLAEFLRQVKVLSERPLKDPADVDAVRAGLAQLEQANQSWLTEPQKKVLAAANSELDKKVVQLEQSAGQWLARVEFEISSNSKDPVATMDLLQNAPAFLPPDQDKRLQQLRKETQARIDLNVLHQIEQLFRKIQDPALQRECLTKLNLLVRK